ncbi:MAG: LCP family protein [Eggerthellaceae bacterium]|jgi:LCP family protein required for cell wall assembly
MAPQRNNDRFSSSRRRRRKDYRSASVDSIIGPEGKRSAGRHGGVHERLHRRRDGKSIDRGEISHVIPQTRSRESRAEYARRSRSGRHLSGHAANGSILGSKRPLVIIAAVVAVLLVVYFAASAAYSGSVTSKMAINSDDVASVLTEPDAATDVSYTLIAADLETNEQSGFDGADVLLLARVDPATPTVSLLAIPGNLSVTLSNGDTGQIGSELATSDAALIQSVSDLVGVDIAHYVKTDRAGLSAIVDTLGGVEVNVDQEVDDPNVSSTYIAAGQQTLNGEQAVTFAAASNYADGSTQRGKNDMTLLEAVSSSALSRSGLDELSMLDAIAGNIKTDYTADELQSLLDTFRSYDVGSTITCVMPGSDSTTDDGDARIFYSSSSWSQTKKAFKAGEDPAAKVQEKLQSVDPSQYTVKVENGYGEAGSAEEVAKALKKAGYSVTSTGNADQYVYTETLVVYKKAKDKTAAEAIAQTLGTGRAVSASIYYSFSTDIEVIVGSDWGGNVS